MPLAKYVKFREEKFGGVLFETRSEKVFTLNAAAAAVVREINSGGDESRYRPGSKSASMIATRRSNSTYPRSLRNCGKRV